MKSRILIVEPSEMILHGLTAMLKNLNYKVLEPRRTAATLDNDLSVLRPEILIINPTLCAAPMQLAQGRSMKVAALVYQYIEQSILNQYDAIIDVRDCTPSSRIARTLCTRPASSRWPDSLSMPCSTTSSISRATASVFFQKGKKSLFKARFSCKT